MHLSCIWLFQPPLAFPLPDTQCTAIDYLPPRSQTPPLTLSPEIQLGHCSRASNGRVDSAKLDGTHALDAAVRSPVSPVGISCCACVLEATASQGWQELDLILNMQTSCRLWQCGALWWVKEYHYKCKTSLTHLARSIFWSHLEQLNDSQSPLIDNKMIHCSIFNKSIHSYWLGTIFVIDMYIFEIVPHCFTCSRRLLVPGALSYRCQSLEF